MADPIVFMIADIRERYEKTPASPAFTRLYEDSTWGQVFAVLHERMNHHFHEINGRATSTRHYWADDSRDLLALLEELKSDLYTLKRAGVDVNLSPAYQGAVDRCRPWLSRSGGSTVPEDFEPIELIKYEPVFEVDGLVVRLEKQQRPLDLVMIGSGSYAHVYSYVDPDYDVKFALKRAKRGLDERDLQRFKLEFDVMKKLSFPYVLEVYRYDDTRNEYRMEYCDLTIREYIRRRNAHLPFGARKRIALQFLYGINYLHRQGLLHRDISLQNVLVKVFGDGAVQIKLSDFGLVKDQANEFTRTQTEMRGTHRDPTLENFRDYAVVNEMFSIAWVIAYIFTGRESLPPSSEKLGKIVHKCAANDPALRYQRVLDLVTDVEQLEETVRSHQG